MSAELEKKKDISDFSLE